MAQTRFASRLHQPKWHARAVALTVALARSCRTWSHRPQTHPSPNSTAAVPIRTSLATLTDLDLHAHVGRSSQAEVSEPDKLGLHSVEMVPEHTEYHCERLIAHEAWPWPSFVFRHGALFDSRELSKRGVLRTPMEWRLVFRNDTLLQT